MRILIKILTAPVVLALTIASLFARFVVAISGALLSGVAVILFIIGVFTIFTEGFRESVSAFVFAFLASPMGLPLFADWLLDRLGRLNFALRSI